MNSSRRHFLRNTAAITAGFSILTGLPEDTLAMAEKEFHPTDKIGVGAIGINGMGWSDLSAMLKANPDTVCTAICDVDAMCSVKEPPNWKKTSP